MLAARQRWNAGSLPACGRSPLRFSIYLIHNRLTPLKQAASLPWFAKNVVLKGLIASKVIKRDWPY